MLFSSSFKGESNQLHNSLFSLHVWRRFDFVAFSRFDKGFLYSDIVFRGHDESKSKMVACKNIAEYNFIFARDQTFVKRSRT